MNLPLWMLSAALAAPPAAAADAPIAGTYVARMAETASALRLGADGRYEWFFSQGALDLAGAGRWTRSGADRLLLTSDPPVVPPRTVFVASGRDSEPGLLVSIVDAEGKPAGFLDVVAEHGQGEPSHGFAQEGEHRFEPEAGRPVTAVRVGSQVYDFVSEAFAVPPGDNVMRFRFEPNDVGKADFQAQEVMVAPRALSLVWRGLNLRYTLSDEREESD